jgi:spermidine synthase
MSRAGPGMQDTDGTPITTNAADTLASQRFLPFLMLLFFGSGCAALIYEIVWLQLLELVIGSSGVSLGVLLGTYMGGMCLGSLMLPRLIPAKMHPLRVYAFLELGIGLIGILVLFGLPLVAELYTGFYWHGVFARTLFAAVCLIPPTLLMGATLPAVARFVKSTPEGVSWMGFFYAGNIAGAVIGCLAAGFFLLRIFDMPTATYVAAVLNLLVAIIALILARRSVHEPPSADPVQRVDRASHQRLVYIAIALSGMSALGAEVVWTRLLSLLLGATVYSFSIILAVFLFGLGLGSGAGSLLSRTCRRPRLALGTCQMLLAGAIAWAALMITKSLPYWPVNPGMYTGGLGPWYIFQLDLLRAAWMVLPAAVLWGASFPLAIAAVASHRQDSGRLVGGIYAANTIGSIWGSLAFSLWIIPQFGTQWAERLLILIAALSAIIAILSFVRSRRTDEPRIAFPALSFSGAVLTICSLIVISLLAAAVSRIPWVMVAWGRFSATYIAQANPEIVDEKYTPPKGSSPSQWYCTYVGEGMNVTVAVTRTSSGSRYFHGAGKVQASSQPQDMRLQRMLGHLSALACNNPQEVKDVLVVACGAGVTAGSFVLYPSIRQITVCDIEPLVPKVVAPMFGRENYHLMDGIDKANPHMVNGKKVSVIYDDGRHFIRTLPPEAKFDVITSDPIDPWVKGSAALNTVEFYEMCKRHLKPGGVMSLWMPLYESNLESAKSMIASFFQVFPAGMLFSNDEHYEGYDAVLLGQAQPSAMNVDSLRKMLSGSDYFAVKESLMEVGFGTGDARPEDPDLSVIADLLATFAVRATDLQSWTHDAQLNRDRDLRLQYLAGMWFNSYLSTTLFQNILSYYRFPDNLFIGSTQSLTVLKQALSQAGRH